MVMIVAGLVTVIFHRLKQPVVLGYIIAGVIIGPHTPTFLLMHNEHAIQVLLLGTSAQLAAAKSYFCQEKRRDSTGLSFSPNVVVAPAEGDFPG